MDMKDFLSAAQYQDNPLRTLNEFLDAETRYETAQQYEKMRFVGYVLEIGYSNAKIITSDPFKQAVGGIPRGSFLIMTPRSLDGLPPHFTLLRVEDVAPTPLGMQVQQTYFELHKKSMPELDVWTQGELQWGALNCRVLGMYFPNPEDTKKLQFSGDVNTVVSAHRYMVFAPTDELKDLIVNGLVRSEFQTEIGNLRLTECMLTLPGNEVSKVPVMVSVRDFMGFRTAMFGKTRLGKSNVVKLIAKGMLDATANTNNVGQLIFDINGEYANDNPQDGNTSLRSAYEARCQVYALTERPTTPSKPLRLNFYEQPESCLPILASMLEQDNKKSNYIQSFASVGLLSIEEILAMPEDERGREIRKIQMYWAILSKAGFAANERRLRTLGLKSYDISNFNPSVRKDLRAAAYQHADREMPDSPHSLDELVAELEILAKFHHEKPNEKVWVSDKKHWLDADQTALLTFLAPKSGSGPLVLRPYMTYHAANATDFKGEILALLDAGKTVILDLGNASDRIRRYFSDLLSNAVFSHQESKFVSSNLGNHFIELYFEEAHNLFPPDSNDLTGVYARFAKEGAKFHIGMVYSTQSPSTINRELLAQTENFFVGHMSSQDETRALSKVQVAFQGYEEDIMHSRTPGYMRMLTFSHRFVVPVQAFKFEAVAGAAQ